MRIHSPLLAVTFLLTAAFPTLSQSGVQPGGNTYYVSPAGDDLASGTSLFRPWRTIARVNFQQLKPGDSVLFLGGAAYQGGITLTQGESGTSAEPITFGTYGVGQAGIVAGTGTGFDLYNVSGIRIDNLQVIGSGVSTNGGIGISFYTDLAGDVKLPYVRIEDCRVTGFRRGGISIGAYNGRTGFEDVRVERCRLERNGNNGMAVWGFYDPTWGQTPDDYAHRSIYVGYSSFRSNWGDPSIVLKHTGSGLEIAQATNVLVEYCTASDNGRDNTWTGGGPVGLWMWDVADGVMQFNESHHNTSGTIDGGGFDLDGGCVRCVLQYNYSHDNAGPGFMVAQFAFGARPLRRATVRYNVSERDGGSGGAGSLQLWNGDLLNPVQSALFYGNTVFVEGKAIGQAKGFRAFGGGQTENSAFSNNIFYTSSGAWLGELSTVSPAAFVGNLYFDDGGSFLVRDNGANFVALASWRATRGQELVAGQPTGFELDPLLTAPGSGGTLNDPTQLDTLDAYRLQPGSVAADGGLFLPAFGVTVGTRDFYGQPVPSGSGLSIGAHEGP